MLGYCVPIGPLCCGHWSSFSPPPSALHSIPTLATDHTFITICHANDVHSVQIFFKIKIQVDLFSNRDTMGMGIVIKVDIKFLTTASVFKTYPQLSVCFISIYDVVTTHKSMTSPSKAAKVPLWWLGGGTSEVQPPDRSHNGQDTRHPHQGLPG